jgi:TolB protein
LALAFTTAVLPTSRPAAQAASARQQPPSSPNGKIVFQSPQGGDGFLNEIYTMDADGKNKVRLTDNDFDDLFPIWSPQGDRIAYLSYRGDFMGDIYLMNPDGTGERPLRDAAHGGPFQTNHFQWSPDGRKIMFAVEGKITVVEVIDADGNFSAAPPQNLSDGNPAYAFDNNAAWSPDGSKIAFISNGCENCFPDVFVINADGTGREQVTNTLDAEFRPAWTPDGRIGYEAWRGPSTNAYVSNVDGTNEQLLTNLVSEVSGPVWSPDGTRVLFASPGPVGAPRGGLYVMNADGTGLTFLTDEVDGGNGLFWSPDGNTIIGHRSNGTTIDVVSFSANAASRRLTNLTKTRKVDDYSWSWQRLPTP